MKPTKVYCDSSTRAACFILVGQEVRIWPYFAPVTVNVGEYQAVILALEEVKRQELEGIKVLTDSRLVVEQVRGNWLCRQAHLQPFINEVRRLLSILKATLEWVPREDNPAGQVLG